MKNRGDDCCKNSINQLRSELHRLIESENVLTNAVVQKKSRELDNLILLYYKLKDDSQELKEP